MHSWGALFSTYHFIGRREVHILFSTNSYSILGQQTGISVLANQRPQFFWSDLKNKNKLLMKNVNKIIQYKWIIYVHTKLFMTHKAGDILGKNLFSKFLYIIILLFFCLCRSRPQVYNIKSFYVLSAFKSGNKSFKTIYIRTTSIAAM